MGGKIALCDSSVKAKNHIARICDCVSEYLLIGEGINA